MEGTAPIGLCSRSHVADGALETELLLLRVAYTGHPPATLLGLPNAALGHALLRKGVKVFRMVREGSLLQMIGHMVRESLVHSAREVGDRTPAASQGWG